MEIIKGDLLDLADQGRFDVVVHGCNCFHTMGAGIARQIRNRYPSAFTADCATNFGDAQKLGTYSVSEVTSGTATFWVVNAYTQYALGATKRLVDYEALSEVFCSIARDFSGKTIGYPKIGAGLAGGDWDVISKIIDTALSGEDHTLVEYAP